SWRKSEPALIKSAEIDEFLQVKDRLREVLPHALGCRDARGSHAMGAREFADISGARGEFGIGWKTPESPLKHTGNARTSILVLLADHRLRPSLRLGDHEGRIQQGQ